MMCGLLMLTISLAVVGVAVFTEPILAMAAVEGLPDQVILSGDWNIVVAADDQASFALNMSLHDVTQDMYKVFGYAPVATIHNDTANQHLPQNSVNRVYIGTPDNAPYLAELTELSTCLSGTESHCLRIVPDAHHPNTGQYWLLAIGADVRGAIFAAYTLSQELLGVDPMFRFTDIQPEFQKTIAVNVSTVNALTFASPQFEYRVIFANDEDLLGGFTPDPLGESVFSLTTFNWLYETTLRLKANAFLVGTVPYPDEKSLTLASRRGLVVTDHHFNLLGINTFRWPSELHGEWSWSKHPSTMACAWKASITAMSRLDEVIWSVGYRGLNDYPAPCTGCSDQEKGEHITQVIGNQTQWVSEIAGADQKMMTYLWAEGIGYLDKGYLTLPKEVSIILTDSGPGYIFGLDKYANISEGVYTHVAMYNGRANQLTEMVPPSRHFDQLGTFVKNGKKTKYIILNTSDLRPVPMTTEAVMRFAFDPKPFMTAATPADAQTQYITQWCKRQYAIHDDSTAAEVAQLYNDYFEIPYIVAGAGDNALISQILSLAGSYSRDLAQTHNVSASLVAKARTAVPVSLEIVRDLYNRSMAFYAKISPAMTEDRRNFLLAHLIGQLGMHRYGCEVQNSVAQSIVSFSEAKLDDATSSLNDAVAFYEGFFAAQRNAETSHWRGLFMNSHLADFHRGRSYVRSCVVAMEELKTEKVVLPATFPSLYYTFTLYQLVNEKNYPLFYPSTEWNMHNLVRISCTNATLCSNNVTGGFFHDQAHITMATLAENATIHYSTDGTPPTSTSPTYNPQQGLVVQATTRFQAIAMAPGLTPVIVSEAVYEKR